MDLSLVPIVFVVLLFSLSFHEAAHAWMAERFGDSTGRYLGRVTLNPIPHIDIFGTVIFPLVCLLTPGALMFGWAKPVPVNLSQMRDRRLGDICVSAAGPLSNALLAIIFFVIYKVLFVHQLLPAESLGSLARPVRALVWTGLTLNVVLMIFNLLPIPPLDGSHVLRNLLSGRAADTYERLEPYGWILMIALLVTGVTSMIINPVLSFVDFLLYA